MSQFASFQELDLNEVRFEQLPCGSGLFFFSFLPFATVSDYKGIQVFERWNW